MIKSEYPQVPQSVMDDIRADIGPFMAELHEWAREADRQIEQQRLRESLEKQNKKDIK
jgi:hypothetical protein